MSNPFDHQTAFIYKIQPTKDQHLRRKSVWKIPMEISVLLSEIHKIHDSEKITLERVTLESLPVSDIVNPKTQQQVVSDYKDSAFIGKQRGPNPIQKKMKKRSYTKPVVVTQPSTHSPLCEWKDKGNVNNWSYYDILGYYFYTYEKTYGYEDASFVGSKWTKSGKTKGKLNNFAMASKVIESFVKFFDEMGYDLNKVKEYIDYSFKWLKTNPWYKGNVSPYKLFSVEKNYLFGVFYKEKLNKPKKKSSYNPTA